MLYWLIKWMIARPMFRALFQPRLVGEENIPLTGGVLLACNHLDAGETVLLPAMVHRRVTFPAKRELFEGPGLRRHITAWFMRGIEQVPMDRSGGQASAAGMASVGEILDAGGALAMFPEGTRSPDGRLYKGKTGVARLALAHNVPVVPVGMIGTQLRRGPFGIPFYRRPIMRFGPPVRFTDYAGAGHNRDALRWVTDEIMNAIMELTGQTYVDMYGIGAKQALARGDSIDHRILARPGLGRTAPPITPAAAA